MAEDEKKYRPKYAKKFDEKAEDLRNHARIIRAFVSSGKLLATVDNERVE